MKCSKSQIISHRSRVNNNTWLKAQWQSTPKIWEKVHKALLQTIQPRWVNNKRMQQWLAHSCASNRCTSQLKTPARSREWCNQVAVLTWHDSRTRGVCTAEVASHTILKWQRLVGVLMPSRSTPVVSNQSNPNSRAPLCTYAPLLPSDSSSTTSNWQRSKLVPKWARATKSPPTSKLKGKCPVVRCTTRTINQLSSWEVKSIWAQSKALEHQKVTRW